MKVLVRFSGGVDQIQNVPDYVLDCGGYLSTRPADIYDTGECMYNWVEVKLLPDRIRGIPVFIEKP